MTTTARTLSLARTACSLVKVLCWSLGLLSVCHCQVSEYFTNPIVNFGNFFHVSFPKGSIDLLYECLCNATIIHCSLHYKLQDGLNNRFGFPYYYTLTNITHTSAAVDQSPGGLYSRSLLCDVLSHSHGDKLNCRRLPVGDDTCAEKAHKCLVYSVHTNSSTCSYDCGLLIWQAAFTLRIQFQNFGSLALPVKDGVCPSNEISSTPLPVFNTTDVVSLKNPTSNVQENSTDSDFEVSLNNSTSNETEQSNGLGFDVSRNAIYEWTGISCLILVVIIVITARIVCFRNRRKAKQTSRLMSESLPLTLSTHDQTGPAPAPAAAAACAAVKTLDTGREEKEVVRYHTLDEMAAVAERDSDFVDCDEQGYVLFHDGISRPGTHPTVSRDEERCCRPLPQPPNSTEKSLYPTHLSVATNSPTQRTSTDDGYVSASSPYSAESYPPAFPALGYPTSAEIETFTLDLRGSRQWPLPRGHLGSDTDDLRYVGLVNLRPDQAELGQETQVKLIRTQDGQLELVSVQDELPAFTEYYTRILLLKQDDSNMGVVAFRDEAALSRAKNFSQDPPRSPVHPSDTTSNNAPLNSASPEMRHPPREDNSGPEVIYIGSLEPDVDMNFEPCDYLTVLDTERVMKSIENGGYLTVLDVVSNGKNSL
ncbi:hypothetical protein ElyMa_001673200 [Elysia marginata]|uniref:Cadherin domain-containing protein n=1 Tax=Elysia marginata TaxID=1093978 RepID=A0AAV4JTN6_9GAST|nr:hypothetical protein ElyMa_001673200 [Elysia marginata]